MYLEKPLSVLEQKREPKTNSTNISLLSTNASAYLLLTYTDGLLRFETFGETKVVFTLGACVQRPSAVLVGH